MYICLFIYLIYHKIVFNKKNTITYFFNIRTIFIFWLLFSSYYFLLLINAFIHLHFLKFLAHAIEWRHVCASTIFSVTSTNIAPLSGSLILSNSCLFLFQKRTALWIYIIICLMRVVCFGGCSTGTFTL